MKTELPHVNIQYKVKLLPDSLFTPKHPPKRVKTGKKSTSFSSLFRNLLICWLFFDTLSTGWGEGVYRVYTGCRHPVNSVSFFSYIYTSVVNKISGAKHVFLTRFFAVFRNSLTCKQFLDRVYTGWVHPVGRVGTPSPQ